VKAEYLVAIEFIGAYVKPPVPGKYDWIYDLDLKSMYPFTIMSLNISPETKVGYVSKFSVSDFLDNPARRFEVNYFGATIEYDSRELRAFLEGENLSISANGILYRQDKRGLIPTILEIWSAERDRFKKLRTEAKLGGDKAQAKYFDRKQGAQKVLLNSLYGVLGLPVFRFYDIQNATAVTSTGRNLLMHTTRAINNM
jgi:DNA polymerase elongation subunit (family B)